MTQEYRFVGKRYPLVEGREKVTGCTRYIADLQFPGMVIGQVILSPYPHARIKKIDKSAAEALPGVVAVFTGDDLLAQDKPVRGRASATPAREKVLFIGQTVVLVVAENGRIAADAAELVEITYEELPAVIHLQDAIKHDAPTVWPDGFPWMPPNPDKDDGDEGGDGDNNGKEKERPKYNNVSLDNQVVEGDVAAGFAAADVIVERTVQTNIVHQGYLEPQGAIAVPSPMGKEGGLDLYVSTQGKYFLQFGVARFLDMPTESLRVHDVDVGGGFGAKYGIYEGLVVMAALAVGRPVKLILTRGDDLAATMPAPAMRMTAKVGAKSDGTITAIQMDTLIDNGALTWPHSGILNRNITTAYKCDNVKLEAYEVHTHKPSIGPYRAPAMPQGVFALESVIDEIAEKLDIDPLVMRMQNIVDAKGTDDEGKPIPSVGVKPCLEAIEQSALWQNRDELGENEGLGLSLGGWSPDASPSDAICRIGMNGTVSIETGHVDLTSNSSALVLIAAEALGVEPSTIHIVKRGTDGGTYAPGSGGSQVTYSLASAVRSASETLAEQVKETAADMLEAAAEDIELADGKAQVRGVPDKALPFMDIAMRSLGMGGESKGPLSAHGRSATPKASFAASAHLVKVHVDRTNGVVTPLAYVCAQDVGFAINRTLVEGQMHGGMLQGLGIGLHEALRYDDSGQLLSGSFLDYDLPKIDSAPELEAILVENRSEHGPYGARGVGEPPIIGGAAAVANGIANAVGYRATELPIRAETVWRNLNNGE